MPTSIRRAFLSFMVVNLAACTQEQLDDLKLGVQRSPLFTNSGFESGNLNGWTVTTGLVPAAGVPTYPVTSEANLGITTGGANYTSAKNGATFSLVPTGLTSADKARYPRFGSWAAMVNESGTGRNANRITQSTVVTTADIDPADGLVHLRFVVLPVLQNPGHTLAQQPYYYVAITNTTRGTTLASRFNFSNEAGVPWQSNSDGSVVYTDWLLFDLPLSRSQVSIGDTLTAVVIAAGCSQSGHWGEAIIDSFGSNLPGLAVYGSGPDSVEAGSDFQYVYRLFNNGTAIATGVKLTAYLPAGTTFRSMDTPGITCATPAVGTRGTVECTVGTVAAGATQLVKVTVRADTTAASPIRHGWYYSASNQEQPLTGPVIVTNVTTGGTTAYVDLITSVDDASTGLVWGQTNTWTVTVRNNGPATATGAVIRSNAPAQLTNLSWTCTPLGGASCGASAGTGRIDTTATLPAGGSAVYAFNARVVTGTGTGMVSVSAEATAPLGTVERYALDNGAGDDDGITDAMGTVTLSKTGTGQGTIVSVPEGMSCGTGCSGTSGVFARGTPVTFQAVPQAGSVFAGWSGACSGVGACTFTVGATQSVTATFNVSPLMITSPLTAKATVGRPFVYTLAATGTAPVVLNTTGAPSWLSWDAANARLTGTPPAAGTYNVTLSASDASGTDTKTLVITAGTPPVITSPLTWTIASSGTGWNTIVLTASGSTPMQWNASNMPGTVYFNGTTRAFAGAANANGVFNVPVVVTNDFGSDYRTIAVSVGGAPVITSPLTASATVGAPFSYTLTATGTAPMTLAVTGLPAWASFNPATGVLSGTPTSAGALSLGLSATNAVGTSLQTLALTVDGPAVITSALTASGTAEQPFSYSLTAEGTQPITRQVVNAPAWATFDAATGLLSGTPPAPGTFTVTLLASNSVGSDSKSLVITIAAPPPTPTPPNITSALTAEAIVGVGFSYTLTASGQVPMTFSASGVPAWAAFDAATGVLSGTPAAAGPASITFTATNALGTDSKTLVVSVVERPHVTSPSTATATVGAPFSYTLTATGTAPLTLAAAGLPAWASFDAASGIISGTPDAAGLSTITLSATNAWASDARTLSLTVMAPPAVTSPATAAAIVGDAFSYTVTATGSAPLTLAASGLPAWASFDSATGVLSGTPDVEGLVMVTLSASNAAGTAMKTLALTVRSRAVITSTLVASAVVGVPFAYTVTAAGTAPVTLSASNLPAWLSFDAATGALSGTPSAADVHAVTLAASNTAGSDTRVLTITVRQLPAITSALAVDAVVGAPFSYVLTASGSTPLSLDASGLPSWASFNPATGVLAGTPDVEGVVSIALSASNTAGSDARTLVVTVRTRPFIQSALAVDAIVGVPFTYTLSATGTAPVTLAAMNLPAWASFDPTSGVISGTPEVAGPFDVNVSATNAAGSDTRTVAITVREAPAITSPLAASAVVGAPFSYVLTASGTAPVLAISGLPAWASFDAATGLLSGTPDAEGLLSLNLSATNPAGSATRTLVVTVRTVPVITSALAAAAVVGAPFGYTLTASGTSPNLSITGLPSWASFDAASGVVSGTPDADAVLSLQLSASNPAGTDTRTLTLTVRSIPAITSSLAVAAVVGAPFSYTLTATGTAPVLAISGLPAWASFDPASGAVTGTPDADGVLSVTLSASNAAGTDTKTLIITVRETPRITSALTADGVVGVPFSYTLTASGTAPSLSMTGLPSWASFDPATGLLSGVPDVEGVVTLGLEATNAAGADTQALVLTTRTLPRLTSATSAVAAVGEAFSFPLTATGTAPITFTVGELPAGLALSGATVSGVPLVAGTFTFTVTATNAVGSDTRVVQLAVRPALTAPSIREPAEGGVVGTATPLIRGTAAPSEIGNTVHAMEGAALLCTAIVDSTGEWSCTAPTLAEGTHTVTAWIRDGRGFDGPASQARQFSVDLTAPVSPRWASPAAGSLLNTSTPQLRGSGEPGAVVTVTRAGSPVCSAIVAADGTWSCAPEAPLPEGANTLTASQTDAAGNASGSASLTFRIDTAAPALPSITAPANGSTVRDDSPVLRGHAEPGSTVQIWLDGALRCTVTAAEDGSWTCATSALADGEHRVAVSSTDAAGNTSATAQSRFVLDTQLPPPVLTAPSGTVRTTRPTFAGTAEPGGTVVVMVDGREVCSTQADANGHFSCQASAPLAEGAHVASATVTLESARSAPSDAAAFTVATATGTVTNPGPGVSSENTVLTGTGTPGATVTVYVDGVAVGTTTVGPDGTWSFTLPLLAPGHHRVSVGITDASGHEVYRSEEVAYDVDRPTTDLGGGIGCSQASGNPLWVLALGVLFLLGRRRRAIAARRALPAFAVGAALVPAMAAAQVAVSSFDLEQLSLNPGARDGLVVGGADLLEPSRLRVSLTAGYENAPLKYFEGGRWVATPVAHRWTTWLTGAAGVLPWLEIGASLPVVLYQNGSGVQATDGTTVLQATRGASLGTPWISGRAAALRQGAGAPLDVAVTVMLGLPLGSSAALARESSVSGQVLVGAGRTVGPVRLAAEFGAALRPQTQLLGGYSATPESVGSRLQAGLAVSTLGTGLRGELSARGWWPLGAQPASVEVLVGARYPLKGFEVYALGGPGFGNAPGTPTFRALVGVAFGAEATPACTDAFACPSLDGDGDGVPNQVDRCPREAYATADGCAPPDSDGDGVPDAADRCPREPHATRDGCVPPDSDGDGVPDGADRCPLEAHATRDGCAPADADGDGVPDDSDACPSQPGTAAEHGCAPSAPAVPQVTLTTERIEVKGTVYFDTGRATLQPRSFGLLDEVAALLKAHPEVKRLSIDGHTDSIGGDALNQPLSLARARAVRDYLVRAGIEGSRLEAHGFGASRPLVPNTTPEGREKNRRVEFLIVE